ncbi:HesA/MoeB/ThiF family protein [Gluconobacter sphaericus]|uniref:HesA/MoeB/ThiF family protein n=1 Tax=Gluconobacter sphaericus TaxID=574987 RepID=UPI00312BC671
MDMNFSDNELERYSRHILLPQVGAIGQTRLCEASVLVVGAGGLGAPLLQQLAASGIGRIGIMDDDRVDLSNLQRQVLYDTDDIGEFKVKAAAKRLKALNALVRVSPHQVRATTTTLDALVPQYDLVCDGTDNIVTRLAVSDACVRHGRSLVSGAVQGFSGQMAVFRPQKGGPCYRCLFPEAAKTEAPNCGMSGVLGAAAGVMGSLMAVEVMREVIGLEGTDQTRVRLWDALSGTMESFMLKRDTTCQIHHDEQAPG